MLKTGRGGGGVVDGWVAQSAVDEAVGSPASLMEFEGREWGEMREGGAV